MLREFRARLTAHPASRDARFAMTAVAQEAHRCGHCRITMRWKPGEHGPEAFYLRLGFRPRERRSSGEVARRPPPAKA